MLPACQVHHFDSVVPLNCHFCCLTLLTENIQHFYIFNNKINKPHLVLFVSYFPHGDQNLVPTTSKMSGFTIFVGAPGPHTYTHRLLGSFSLCVSHSLSLCFGSLMSENPRLPPDPHLRPQRLDKPSNPQ